MTSHDDLTDDLIDTLKYYRERLIKVENENKILLAIIDGSQKLCKKEYQTISEGLKQGKPKIIKMYSHA